MCARGGQALADTGGLITVFGGAGFLGRYLVKRLAATGRPVRVAVRDPEGALFLRPMGAVGQIDLVAANVRDDASVARAVRGAAAVVNMVGVLAERGRQTFDAVHVDGAERVARASRSAGAARFVHVSAVAADAASPSRYGRSKAAGETKVRAAFPDAMIVRPSIVFGAEDGFLNRFGALARLSPVLPVFGGHDGCRFQPVYVGDVAEALFRIVGTREPADHLYEFGGPDTFTWRAILEFVLRETGRRRPIASLPWAVGSLAALVSPVLPLALLRVTFDHLRQLHRDTVVSGRARGLVDLGVAPTPVATIAPSVLERFRRNALVMSRLV
ncbi:MAG: complex I NDUFA9 subunit family protein [Alphaproteobacteria bacterium]|nr:complex I NDUFA9 subunit family protein [Alphaproteobacteria bacterium]